MQHELQRVSNAVYCPLPVLRSFALTGVVVELQLRERRRVVESAREKEALDDLRGLIERMKTLEKDLNAAVGCTCP